VRTLVTGAAGFVGAGLTRRLLGLGHEVHVLVKSPTNRWRLVEIERDLACHAVDLRDEAGLRALVQSVRPEVIYHLAAHGAYPSQDDPDEIIQSNMLGTWNLLKAASTIDYATFVNTGSSSEYGFKETATRETDYLEPNSYYSVAKCAQTLLCQHVARVEKRSINTLRLYSVFGPFEEPSRLVPTVIRSCLQNKPLKLVPRDIARDFIFVDDVIDAYLRLGALERLSGEIINIGTGLQSTVGDVVDHVLAQTGAQVACEWGAMAPRQWDARIWVADCTKSYRLLGWRAQTVLGEGLRRTVDWMGSRM
jgi:nucleoside-diphosphate-sugar epimerase